MSYHHSHISSAVVFLQSVKNTEPLVNQLKRFFAANKKYGSKDRKSIAALCYTYFRIGLALPNKSIEEKILSSLFLSNYESNDVLAALAPNLNATVKQPFSKKLLQLQISNENIFPYINELSQHIEPSFFVQSFFKQPLLFLRARPLKVEQVFEKLSNSNLPFEEITTTCIALPAATKVDELFEINKEVVIQDKNSQQVFNYLNQTEVFLPINPIVWDCCAASGGKSILLYDLLHGKINLQVSDVRASMLNNLKNRFSSAGIKNYKSKVVDMLSTDIPFQKSSFDIIICDAPCTGSGTWARTPEQLSFFNKPAIKNFQKKQEQIATNAIPFLKKGGLFFYITCSVFKQENETVVDYLKVKFHLQVLQMEYLKGYQSQADTMFVAVLSF